MSCSGQLKKKKKKDNTFATSSVAYLSSFFICLWLIFSPISFIAGPLVAALLNSYSHRKVTLAGVLLATTGLLLSALYIKLSTAPSIVVLYITIGLVTGLGFGLMDLASMDIVEHFFSRRLGLAMGLVICGSGIGQLVLAPLLYLATDLLGLAEALFCSSATVATAVFFALLYRCSSSKYTIKV